MNISERNSSGLDAPFQSSSLDEIRARRNRLAGYWVGRKLGLSGDDLGAYVENAHQSDYEITGDADIIAKLMLDLAAHGENVSEREVGQLLKSCHRQSLLDSHSTD